MKIVATSLLLLLLAAPSFAQTNIALGKPAVASSVETSALAAAKAVDGSTGTRWSSAFAEPQWLYVDLGAPHSVSRVVLRWEAAYAVAYRLEVSQDAQTWTAFHSTTAGKGGVETISPASAPVGRYVRIYCQTRTVIWGAKWGFSLWELEVNGSPTSTTSPSPSPSTSSLATGKPARSSSNESAALSADKAVDGQAASRWGSAFAEPQWLAVDLGARYAISKIVLSWEAAYASAYRLEVSDDGATWRSIYATTSGRGGVETITPATVAEGRHVRVYCERRVMVFGAYWGFSIWELQVHGAAVTSSPPPATAYDRAINPGENIQSIVDGSPTGTRFLLKAGVHRRQQIRPKSGMVFMGEPGAVLDGENVTAYAFETLATAPSGVVIQDLVIERYVPPSQRGAIQGDNGVNWRVEHNEIRNNANHGLRAGTGMRILNNHVHHNGVVGIAGYMADGVLVEGNEVSYNNTLQASEDPVYAEASGIKFMKTRNLVIRNNRVHHNMAKGIWTDHAWPTTLIEHNTVNDNASSGIWHEVSYDAVIRYNTISRNGGTTAGSWLSRAGIQVTNSPNVKVHNNTLTGNANGIGVTQAAGYTDGPYGANVVQNLEVYSNIVTMSVGRTGLAQNVGDTSIYTSRNNRFYNNTYYLGSNAYYFLWNERALDERGWQSYGQDLTGTFYR
jgi:parallel beta-helix repeat protein